MLFDFENKVCHMSQSTFNTMMRQKNSFRVFLKILISSWNVRDDDDDDDDNSYESVCFISINFKSYLLLWIIKQGKAMLVLFSERFDSEIVFYLIENMLLNCVSCPLILFDTPHCAA